jgi:hypothetical protein
VGWFTGPLLQKPTNAALWNDCSAGMKLKSFSVIRTLGEIVLLGGNPLRIGIINLPY